MVEIVSASQLSTFSTVRSILLSNTVLASRFSLKNVLEFEPKVKSANFCGFPYIVVNVPGVSDLQERLGNSVRAKEFDVEIVLRLEYDARSRFSEYASAIVSVLDMAESQFCAAGYSLVLVGFDGPPSLVSLHDKELVEGRFSLILFGEVRF